MSWEDWRNNEEVWRPAMDSILSAARSFSAEHPEMDIGIVPLAWDAPDVELHWNNGQLSRNLHATLEGTQWPLTVRYTGAVWRDAGGERQSRGHDFGSVTASGLDERRAKLPGDIASAVEQITGLLLHASRSASAD